MNRYLIEGKSVVSRIQYTGDLNKSINKFLSVQKLLKKDDDNYYLSSFEFRLLGYNLLEEQKIEDSIELYQLYIKLFPKYAWAHAMLGEVYQINGNIKSSIESYKSAITLNPNNNYFRLKLKEVEKR